MDRPVVHCIVAWWPTPESECVIRPKQGVLTLEEAVMYADAGFAVMTDPFDMEALTRWEQLQRVTPPTWRWKPKS